MIMLMGNDPFKKGLEKSLASFAGHTAVLPLDDCSLLVDGSPWRSAAPGLTKLVTDRAALREFCRGCKISVPQGKIIETFEELAKVVISKNRFPLALKARRNSSGGKGVYRLEGFRELERFFEKIRESEEGSLIVEDWVPTEAVLEMTLGPGGFKLFSQAGLDKKLSARTAWRMFPVAVPASFKKAIETIEEIFLTEFGPLNVLIRFTIGLLKGEAHLLSLNAGVNRLEYFPTWSEHFGLLPAMLALGPSCEVSEKKQNYGRIQIFRRSAKMAPWPEVLPKEISKTPVLNYLTAGKLAAVLWGGENPRALAEYPKMFLNMLPEG